MNQSRQFSIFVENKSKVENHLKKLAKRAIKLNLPDIEWSFGKPTINDKGMMMLPVTLTGPIKVSYQDWEFVATLQHLPSGENVIRSLVEEPVPAKYREAGSNCEHCKVNRYRKDTYLVRHKTNNSYVQVGSSCMKDFLGNNSPDNILQKATFVGYFVNYLQGGFSDGTHNSEGTTYFVDAYLAQTSACISVYGWLSKTKAYETGARPTVSYIKESILYTDPKVNITDLDVKKAQAAIEWAEELTDEQVENSDYLFNIRAIVRSGIVVERTMGFAASIIPAYERDTNSKKPKYVSEHVGTIKQRISLELELTNKFEFFGNYGITYKYLFKDSFGNILVWNASSCQDFLVGQKYLLKGTIKAHKDFKGIKQTEINRCEILCQLEN